MKKLMVVIVIIVTFVSINCFAAFQTNLKTISSELKSADPNAPSDQDLMALDQIVDSATVVGLGEATHGTREFFQMKARVIKYLITKKGFTVFAIESPMINAEKINEYVLNGQGNLRELAKNYIYGLWRTKDFMDLIEWMREYNSRTKNKVYFFGIDPQFNDFTLSLKTISDAFSKIQDRKSVKMIHQIVNQEAQLRIVWEKWLLNVVAPYYLESQKIKDKYSDPIQRNMELNQLFFNIIQNRSKKDEQDIISSANDLNIKLISFMQITMQKEQAITEQVGYKKYQWILQNIRLLQQGTQAISAWAQYSNRDDFGEALGIVRDKAMAANTIWIRDFLSQAKIILWAHNGHISNYAYNVSEGEQVEDVNGKYRVMGRFLKDKLSDKYRPIGLTTYEGTYRVNTIELLQLPPADSFEMLINQLNMPFALINLINKQNLPDEIKAPIYFRSVSGQGSKQQFFMTDIALRYDAIIYIHKTEASQLVDLSNLSGHGQSSQKHFL